jgi:TonB family protein
MPLFVNKRRSSAAVAVLLILSCALPAQNTDELLQQRAAAYEEVIRLLTEQRYAEALDPANLVMHLSEQAYGPEAPELVTPLTDLATVQVYTGDYAGARDSAARAILIIERHRGLLASELIMPLHWLAQTYLKAGEYRLGENALLHALRINHANQGFYNLDQITIRDELSETYLALGELDKANFHQQTPIDFTAYTKGKNSSALAASHFKLARWYGRTGQTAAELSSYRSAYRIMARASGENNPELIETLRYMSSSYVIQAGNARQSPRATSVSPLSDTEAQAMAMRNGAIAALRRAIEINAAQPFPDLLLHAELLMDLGDAYTLFGAPRSAKPAYQNAWDIYSEQEDHAELLEGRFGSPIAIGETLMPRYYPPKRSTEIALASNPEAFGDGVIVLRFDVNKGGAVKNIQVIEADPPDTLERRAKKRLRYAHYRPAMKNREPISTTGLTYRLEFKYAFESTKAPEQKETFEPLPNPNLPAN